MASGAYFTPAWLPPPRGAGGPTERSHTMTLRKKQLIEAFIAGRHETQDASREQLSWIQNDSGEEFLCLIGYGWAVYSLRLENGEYLLFGDGYATHGTDVGWAGYSGQTTQHLQEIKGMFEQADVPYSVIDTDLAYPTSATWTTPPDSSCLTTK